MYKKIKKKIAAYGYEYSFMDYLKYTLLTLAGIGVAGYIYGLWLKWLVVLLWVGCFVFPIVVVSQYRYLYEQQRFQDSVSYLEQMIYAFQKRPKILNALRDVEEIVTGRMKEQVQKAITYLEKGQFEINLYQEALKPMEKIYGSERMIVLHRFLEEIEEKGGQYRNALDLLLDDIKAWNIRVYQFQKKRNIVKNNVTLAIGLSLVVCFATTKMFPAEFSVKNHVVYQFMTSLFLVLMMLIFGVVQSKMSGSWMETEVDDGKYKKIKWDKVHHFKVGKILLVFLMICCLYGVINKNSAILLVSMIALGIILTQPKRSMKAAKTRYMREIRKTFPYWIRNLSLSLQRENVQVAIANSVKTAPCILKEPLNQLVDDLEKDPVSIQPYIRFLGEYDMPEISSAMKMLYALNMSGKEEIVSQMDSLVERNTKLLAQGEEMKEEDHIAVLGFSVAIPMIFSLMKLVTDFSLMILKFLTVFSNGPVI